MCLTLAGRLLVPVFGLAFAALFLPAEAETGTPVQHGPAAYLGVSVQGLTPPIREALGLEQEGGVLVGSVVPGSPAEEAGIEIGDILVQIDDRELDSPADLTNFMRGLRPGQETAVVLLRNSKKRTVRATLGSAEETGPANARAHIGLRRGAYLGIQMHDPNQDLAPYFGIRPGEGVLVLLAEDGGPAAEAGLRSGDVITAFGEDPTGTSGALLEAILEAGPGEDVRIRCLRKGTEWEVTVRLGEKPLFPWGGGKRNLSTGLPGAFRNLDDDLKEQMERLDREVDLLKEKIRELEDR